MLDYRAWRPDTRTMYEVLGWLAPVELAGYHPTILTMDTHGTTIQQWDDGLTELLPFVGRVDKHGKKVYCGDIIRAVFLEMNGEPREELEEVCISEGGLLGPFLWRVWCEEEWWEDHLQDGFEVVGTIYEWPQWETFYREHQRKR